MNNWMTLLLAFVGSSAAFGFLQFLIQRHDSKKGFKADLYNKFASLEKKVDILSGAIDEYEAVNARIRILQASDEMSRKIQHSKEFFDQLNEDITAYNRYCMNHAEFQNNKSVQAIANINKVYQQCLSENSFL